MLVIGPEPRRVAINQMDYLVSPLPSDYPYHRKVNHRLAMEPIYQHRRERENKMSLV